MPPEIPRPTRPWLTWLLLLLATAPAWFQLSLIIRYGVNCPIADEWNPDIAGLFVKAHEGTLRLIDFWPLDNEHRIVLPRIIILLLGWLTHFDSRGEMVFSWLCCWGSSLILLWLIRQAAGGLTRAGIGRWFACNALIFSISQYENVITGLGLINILPNTIILLQIVLMWSRLSPRARYWVGMALAIVNTYTFGNGVLAWVTGSILIAWSDSPRTIKKRIPALILWYAVCIACMVIYMIGYKKPELSPPLGSFTESVMYGVRFSGNLLTYTVGGAQWALLQSLIAGIVFLAVFAMCVAYFLFAYFRREDEFCGRMIVWMTIAGYAFLSMMIAAVLRGGNPAGQATASRYISYSIFLPIAVFNMLPVICEDAVRRLRPMLKGWSLNVLQWTPAGFTAIVVAFVGTAIKHGLWQYFYMNNDRRMAKAALLLIQILPNNGLIYQFLYPWQEKLLPMAQQVNALGLIKPPLISTPDLLAIADPVPPGVSYGKAEELGQQGSELMVRGYAIAPERGLPADSVILTCDDPNGIPMIVAMCQMNIGKNGKGREDIAKMYGNDLYEYSGWIVSFGITGIPPGMKQLVFRAWELNVTTGRLHKLEGDFVVQVQ